MVSFVPCRSMNVHSTSNAAEDESENENEN